ncbi:golgin subfamily A member 6-like protein 1 [Pseudorasbora parva]|uniref:golgin subfamily A member 6-like protein 1 n=1 Tax=Pseudorasbora parva TaxID=51549 RepID=UPI00351EB58C
MNVPQSDSGFSNDSMDHPPVMKATKRRLEEVHGMLAHHDATLLEPGPPAIYRLNTERKYIEGTGRKVRQWTYGRRDRYKQNKVILMVGETGAGKTTLINTMINHLMGVTFEDEEFYHITEEQQHKDQSQSQTRNITVYEAFVEENPTALTIIDTPGYGHTEGFEKDREISEYLSRLFSDEDGVHYIDAVCFVMKASQNHLSAKELYIFHSVLSLFGRDIENNIVFLLTHSDGGPPTDALNPIKIEEIPCRRDKDKPVYFLFNNRQKEKRHKRYERVLKSSWEMGEESMNEFLTLLKEDNRKSVKMTLDVLKERRRLEACVSNLKERIKEMELKTEELNQIQEALRQNRENIKKCVNFQFTVKRSFKEKVPIENEWWWNRNATCCSVCEENCHEWNCSMAPDPSWCWVMKNDHCTVCSGKCDYSKHVRENKKYVTKIKDVIMTFEELKQEYERTDEKHKTSFDKTKYKHTKKQYESSLKETQKKTEIEENLKRDLEKIKEEKSRLLHEAYKAIVSLSKIALKANSALSLHHLEFLIPRLKEERKDEWVKNLEDLREVGEERKNKGALEQLWGYFSRLTGKN